MQNLKRKSRNPPLKLVPKKEEVKQDEPKVEESKLVEVEAPKPAEKLEEPKAPVSVPVEKAEVIE